MLLGVPADETRLLVHHGRALTIPLPGHPALAATLPAPPPAYDVVATLADLAVEIGVRVDELPRGNNPTALAASLTQAYALTRAQEVRRIMGLRPHQLGAGFDAGTNTIYTRRDAGPTPQMEHLTVLVRDDARATYAVHVTVRYAAADLDVVRWNHLRAALAGGPAWDDEAARTAPAALWPAESAFAALDARLQLTAAAQAEAERKATELGPLDEAAAAAFLDALVTTSGGDEPPTATVTPAMREGYCARVAAAGPTRAGETLLRNSGELRTVHDVRAWCWQGIEAIRRRPDAAPPTGN